MCFFAPRGEYMGRRCAHPRDHGPGPRKQWGGNQWHLNKGQGRLFGKRRSGLREWLCWSLGYRYERHER